MEYRAAFLAAAGRPRVGAWLRGALPFEERTMNHALPWFALR